VSFDLVIGGGRLEGRAGLHDIAIAGERIAAIGPGLEGADRIDAGGRLVSPAFVQPHIHLDKVLTGPLLGPNESGTLAEAIALSHRVKRAATVEEVRERAGRVIRQAVMAGTSAIRSHVDVDTIGGLKGLRGVAGARADHADLCEIQLVAFPQEGIWRDRGADVLMAEAMREGADVVGGMPHWEDGLEEARRHIVFCLDLAVRHDADVDMHVDETDDPYWRSFEILVEEADRRGWGPRTTAGHVCAMAAWEDAYAAAVIRRAAAAGVMVATNAPTNLMLQGRADAEPRRRGIPRVKELLAAGVTVAAGQDCVDDAFYPFGTADPLQVALIVAHAAQLGTPAEIAAALRMVTDDAARLLRLPDYGLHPGGRADLVILDAETARAALREQAARRWVLHGGRVVAETVREQRLHPASGRPGAPLSRAAAAPTGPGRGPGARPA
jgi:cytosine/creatinine deaminase